MKKLVFALTFAAASMLALAATSRDARAEIGTADQVPAATLLLPYFEVKLDDPATVSTSFSINNASNTAVLAHVTLWTDEGIPTFVFDVYLTGYDTQNVNLSSLFDSGLLPITASVGQDSGDTPSPNDGISNAGLISQDVNFASCTGTFPYSSPELSSVELRHIRTAHTGRRSDVLNGCAAAAYGDFIARGYVTVDTVNQCNTSNPSTTGYFAGVATAQNVLWGDYSISRDSNNSESTSPLVHIEACGAAEYVGNGAGHCPFAPGDYTFYGRLNAFTATDVREPLATTFISRFVNSGDFTGGTDLLVWRDSKTAPTGANGKHKCNKKPSWYPLAQSDVVSFTEEEEPTDLCFLPDNVSPPIGGAQSCFPLVAQRVSTETGSPLGFPVGAPSPTGFLYLNLNHTLSGGDPQPGVAQAWVETVMSASGRFAVGFQAIALDNATTTSPGGVLLLP